MKSNADPKGQAHCLVSQADTLPMQAEDLPCQYKG